MCGVTGLKPTYGRVSRHGLIAYASSLDCIGACARTADDLALWLDVVAGSDPADPTSLAEALPPLDAGALPQRLDGLRLGVPVELFGEGVDAEVGAAIERALVELRGLGARTVPCSLPSLRHAIAAYYLIATAEASSNLARYDGVRYGQRHDGGRRGDAGITASRSHGLGEEVQLRILLGTFALQAGYQDDFYRRADAVRGLLRAEFARAFAACDLLLCATAPQPAFRLGSQVDDPLAMYRGDALTVPMSLCGLPALSLPCGATRDGRPIGMQLTAPARGEHLLLQTAAVFQRHSDHHLRRALP
jgi:aspartyl-tRNA(Asn)/glutamyl-tRNA(Gln) amidotransferase subunit A